MRWLRDQTHAKGCANTADCIETRFAAWPKSLVQSFSGDTGILRNLSHAPRAGNIAERSRQQCRVILFKNGGEVGRYVFFATEVLGCIELGYFRIFDSLGHG